MHRAFDDSYVRSSANSTEVRLLSETDNLLACHWIAVLLWNPLIHYHVHKSFPKYRILRHFHMRTLSVTSVLLLSYRLNVSLRSPQTFRYNFYMNLLSLSCELIVSQSF